MPIYSVYMYSHVLPYIARYTYVLLCIAMYTRVLPCIAIYCQVVPCIPMYYQCITVDCHVFNQFSINILPYGPHYN